MINQTLPLLLILCGIEAAILFLASTPKTKQWFSFLPALFWVYFIPMIASFTGLIPSEHPVYSWGIRFVLPTSLILLLIPVNLKDILKLGKSAILMMFLGSFSIMLGTVLAVWLFQSHLTEEWATGFGTLSASWLGGSSNMIAVKEAVGTPDSIFAPLVIVDTVAGYSWMGFLIFMSAYQLKFDRWNSARRTVMDDLAEKMKNQIQKSTQTNNSFILIILFLAMGGTWVATLLSQHLPIIEGVLSKFTWVIIMASSLGILFSFTSLQNMSPSQTNNIGNFALYFVLTCIGAKASLSNLGDSFLFLAIGFTIILFHGVILFTAARLLKVPLFLLATASQANIGGVASAPLVAATYQPSLAPVGLLLAVLGNITGTYLGILTVQLCRFASQL